MRFAVVVFACVLAAVSAQQYNKGQYVPQNDQYNQYNQYNRYNRYNPYPNYNNYNNYNRYPNQNRWGGNYQPYVQPTPYPRPTIVTAKPVVVTPAPAVSVDASPSPVPSVVPVAVPVPKPSPVVPVSVVRVAADDRSAELLKYGNEIGENGFNYYFESNNGIAAQAQGSPRNFGGNPPVVPDVIQGAFSWTSPEGKLVSISYTADENGYQPSGDAIPQPPEIPAQIARALEYAARYTAGVKN